MEDRVDSTQIDRNEMDEVQRQAIKHDEAGYQYRKSLEEEWIEVLGNLDVLEDGRQVSEKVICNNILQHWWDVRFSPGERPIYLPFTEVHMLSWKISHGGQEDWTSLDDGPFGNMYQSTASRLVDKRVCFFLHRNLETKAMENGNHFFPVLFDYDAGRAWAYGVSPVPESQTLVESALDSDWDCWFGPQLWTTIAFGMGWGEIAGLPQTMSVVAKNWPQVPPFCWRNGWGSDTSQQNGFDCGIYTLKILRKLTMPDKPGDLLDSWSKIDFPTCSHEDRRVLLTSTAEWINSGLKMWMKLRVDEAGGQTPSYPKGLSGSNFEHIMDSRFNGIDSYRRTMTNLTRASLACPDCFQNRRVVASCLGLEVDNRLVDNRPRPRGLAGDVDDREVEDLSDGEDEAAIDLRRELLELAQRLGGQVVTGRKALANRSKPVQPYKFREERPMGVVKGFNPEFDSYKTGPTAEMVVQSNLELCAEFQNSPAVARWSTVGARFSDHGYRRTAGGFHQFYMNQPPLEDQLAHFFPLPPQDVLDQWKEYKNATEVDLVELREDNRPLPESLITGNDIVVWKLEDMVKVAERQEMERMKAYITGRTNSGSYIRLDIQKSRRPLQDLKCSADVDSIIWLTDRLKVLGSINIHLLPFLGIKAPIGKHNHTYVNLYWPRTEEDVKKAKLSSACQEVPISNLPNTHFAHFGKAEGSAEIFIVFPRMKHRYPLRKVSETKLPYEVETFWLENLVYASIRRFSDAGTKPYRDWGLDDNLYKYRGMKEKTLVLSPDQLDRLQDGIQRILEENKENEAYYRFGSFFFLLQVVGIKVPMSMDENWAGLWEKLVSQYQSFDWDYMQDPENGELLLDLGIGIHPPEDAQVVGFWDVEALRQGFNYGGYNQGTTHGVFTIPAIGGIHAEMGSTRRRRTHIAYRLAYNLVYEVLRSKQTRRKEAFLPARSAYNLDHDYRSTIDGVIGAYQRSMKKSFGVRDEYRCRAYSIRAVLPVLRTKVRERLSFL